MQWTVAIGVDTHKRSTSPSPSTRLASSSSDSREIAATAAGYRSLLAWTQELGVPAIEGTGSYGRRPRSLPRASRP